MNIMMPTAMTGSPINADFSLGTADMDVDIAPGSTNAEDGLYRLRIGIERFVIPVDSDYEDVRKMAEVVNRAWSGERDR